MPRNIQEKCRKWKVTEMTNDEDEMSEQIGNFYKCQKWHILGLGKRPKQPYRVKLNQI